MAAQNQMRAGADYLFNASPEECLNSAMSYLSNQGYEIETRTENQVTMSRHSITTGFTCLVLIVSVFTLGAALLAFLVAYLIKRRATVVAMPAEEGLSRVTITWSNDYAKKALEAWIAAEWGERARPADRG
jgi:hypothetical protein